MQLAAIANMKDLSKNYNKWTRVSSSFILSIIV
jgi:hypothetical protein